MERAMDWLERCQREHPQCFRAFEEEELLPTRVLDVGTDDAPNIKLHISGPEERGKYFTLSYCWGGDQPAMTTRETITAYSEEILLESLPQTIRDAVTVTRSLGFRFLWIDVLCIVQDSDADKECEISQMGRIYKKSSLTIIASNATSVEEGCLRNIPSETYLHVPMVYQNGKGWSQTGWSHEAVLLPLSQNDDSQSFREPLETRGWALQETLLSPRVLAFGTRETTWRCL